MGSFCTGGNQVTQDKTQTYTPSAQGVGALNTAQNWLSGVNPGNAPLQGVAGLTNNQTQGIGGIANTAQNNPANPYFQAGSNFINQSAQAPDTQSFLNPYNQYQLQNWQQYAADPAMRNARTGAVGAAGGIGAERNALANSNAAFNTNNQLGGLLQGQWNSAAGQAAQQRSAQQAAGALNFAAAPQALGSQLTGYNAQLGAGGVERGAAQDPLTALYNQQQQAFQTPFQLAQSYGSLAPNYGGTQTGQQTTTYPQQSIFGQIAGLVGAGAGAYKAFGSGPQTQPAAAASGGRIQHMAGGGMSGQAWQPFDFESPNPSQGPKSPMQQMTGGAQGLGQIAKMFNPPGGGGASPGGSWGSGAGGEAAPLGGADPAAAAGSAGGGLTDIFSGIGSGISDAAAGIGAAGSDALASILPMLLLRQGGRAMAGGGSVNPYDMGRGYAEGGTTFGDRWGAANDAIDDDIWKDKPGATKSAFPLREIRDPLPEIMKGRPSERPSAPAYAAAEEPMLEGRGAGSSPDENPFAPGASGSVGGSGKIGGDAGATMPPPISAAGMPSIPQFNSGRAGSIASNPWMSLIMGGLAGAASGERDAHGLPKGGSPFGQLARAIGVGGQAGIQHLGEQAKIENQGELAKFNAGMQQLPYSRETATQSRGHNIQEAQMAQAERLAQLPYNRETAAQARGHKIQEDQITQHRDLALMPYHQLTEAQRLESLKPFKVGTDPDTGLDIYAVRNPQTHKLERWDAPPGQGASGAEGKMVAGLTPEALHTAAENYRQTGQFPPNLGRSPQDRFERKAILNKAQKLEDEAGGNSTEWPNRWQDFRTHQVALNRFNSGPTGNNIRGLNVAVDHMATLSDMIPELKNGNIVVFNKLAQMWAQQTGQPAPTNFDQARQIIGTEIIKALGVAGAGTVEERTKMADSFNRANSPAQLVGAIETAEKLLGGQLRGLRQQFTEATGRSPERFNNLLFPETREKLERWEKKKTETKAGPAKAAPERSAADKQALDWATANPDDPRALAIKKRLGVQ